MAKYFRSIVSGLAGFIALNIFYSITMRILGGSWYAVISQFEKLWYFMLPLTLGFGIQVGLYAYLKRLVRDKVGKGMVMANTATSTIGMVACCAHHLTDILPFIGLTAFSTLLISYQSPILFLGIFLNIIGIYYSLRKIKQLTKN
ncbi:MAG: hypothetical protein UT63_C0015G0014 [Candidatus Gottesmanbacteria bacterium GW2011_GWC2_39_8]|uniref:Uncharacterized protein n=1 Tax=Candidatus Gottesmanbacteria bacterium GW2011_GWC2_39_8 TaxID=1618450 RepID=A0A0G0Q043_9BACT|nr:MAG: hypothetical protein UT63_C0015G0014 [Candidatus Gottesmanbacteria bacterium GW2011_GWC2_39_8]